MKKERTWSLNILDYGVALSYIIYAASVTFTPISLVVLSRDLNFSISSGGVIEIVRTGFLVFMMFGSSWVSSFFGKIKSLRFSLILLGMGQILYSQASSYLIVLIAMGIVGFASGVTEALLNPLVQDNHPNDSGKYLNLLNAFFSIGVLLTTILGGEFLTRGGSWRTFSMFVGILSILSSLLFCTKKGNQFNSKDIPLNEVMGQKKAALKDPRFWLFAIMIFLGGGSEGGIIFWSATYIQLNFEQLPRIGALGTASFATGMIIGRLLSSVRIPQKYLWHLLISSSIFGCIVGIFLPFQTSIALLILSLFLLGLGVACLWPTIQSYAADRTNIDTTVLFILLALAGIPGLGFTSWLMGIIGKKFGIGLSFFVIPSFLLLLSIVLIIERVTKKVEIP